MTRYCPTCARPVYAPYRRLNVERTVITEGCVDPCHDEHVLGVSSNSATFLRNAIKKWRGTTRQASLRMYGVAVPPTLEAV